MPTIRINDSDVVSFDSPVAITGTWKKAEGEPSIAHRTVITGEISGLQLRSILEGASSLRVRAQNQVLRKGKDLPTKATWAEFLAKIAERKATVVYVEKKVSDMTKEEAEQHMKDLREKFPEYFQEEAE
jgi:hypothetical protein